MAMEITNSYNSYAAPNRTESSPANSAKKKEVTESRKSKGTAEYASELAKLVPSVEFKVGMIYSSAKSGKTLTVNPKLLKEMQSNPEKEKEVKEMIKGVESMTNLMDSIHKASGWTVVYRHSYIDENGKYCEIACVRNEFGYKMSEKLREERKQNAEKLLEKQKEKSAEKKEDIEEMLKEKLAESKDGVIYLYDTDFKKILEAEKEEDIDKSKTKKETEAGANLDLQV